MSTAPEHAQMKRVFDAAIATRLIKGDYPLTEVAAVLGESPQTVKNWCSRGVSAKGALKIQEIMGISADHILRGAGPVMVAKVGSAATAVAATISSPLIGVAVSSHTSVFDARKTAAAIRAVLELGRFPSDALGTIEELVRSLDSAISHTPKATTGTAENQPHMQNTERLPPATEHRGFFRNTEEEQKKSPEHGKGEG